MLREKLPDRRESVTTEASLNGLHCFFTLGFYPDGRVGELFVDLDKYGSAIRAWAGAASMLVSIMLQYGVPLAKVVQALKGWNELPFSRAAVEGVPGVQRANGVLDMIAQHLEACYKDKMVPAKSTLDLLAEVLDMVACEDAETIREAMADRGAESALDAFLGVFQDAEDG